MAPRYVLNSLTRQTIDTTIALDAAISSPSATVTTIGAYNDLTLVDGNPKYSPTLKKLVAQTAGVTLTVEGYTPAVGDLFFLAFAPGIDVTKGGVYELTVAASTSPDVAWQAKRATCFSSDQAIAIGSHVYAITAGVYAHQFVAIANKEKIVLDTTGIQVELGGSPPTNEAVGSDYVNLFGQTFLGAGGPPSNYALPQLQSGNRRRVEVNIYGSNAAHDALFLEQDNFVALNSSGTSIGASATNNPTFQYLGNVFGDGLTVTYEPGTGGFDQIRIESDAALTSDLECTVQMIIWDTSIT